MSKLFDSLIEWLAFLWWSRIPKATAYLSKSAPLLVSDGMYLVAYPLLAAAAPLLALIMGIVCGWQRFGAIDVFSQSAVLLAIAIILGFFGGNLGAMFLVGYATIDFFIYRHPMISYAGTFDHFVIRLGLLVTYIALAGLIIFLPTLLKIMRSQIPIPPKVAPNAFILLDGFLSGIFGAIFVFLYLQAIPMLVRPLFTWHGDSPPTSAMIPLQAQTWIFALIALVTVFLRVIIEYSAAATDVDVIIEFTEDVQNVGQESYVDRVPWKIKVLLQALFCTILFSGLLDSWTSFFLLSIGLAIAGFARQSLASYFPVWPHMMQKVPSIVRLLAVLAVMYFFLRNFLADRLNGSSFQPLIWSLLVSLVFLTLMFPEPARTNKDMRPQL